MILPSKDLSQKGIPLLLAEPPQLNPRLEVRMIEGSTYHVEAPELPALPAWQTRDLVLWDYYPPWLGLEDHRWNPLSQTETTQQDQVAVGMVQKLIGCLRDHTDVYIPLRKEFWSYQAPIVLGLTKAHSLSGLSMTDVDWVLFAALTVFDLEILVVRGDGIAESPPTHARINPDLEIAQKLKEHAPIVRRLLRQCLEDIGYHPDYWLEGVLLGLLLHPLGLAWIRHPIQLGPTGGGTNLERGIELAIGVPDTTYRAASKVHRSYRKELGAARIPDKPGPKPGQHRRTSDGRRVFEDHVVNSAKAGLSAYLITQDAEAQRLYRRAWNDHSALLSEQTVRRVLRKHG